MVFRKKKNQKFSYGFSLLFGPVSSLFFDSNIFSRVFLLGDTSLEDKRWSDFNDLSARTNFEHRTNPSPDEHDITVFDPNNDQISTLSPLILITFARRAYIVRAYGFYEQNVLILLCVYGVRKKINNIAYY